MLKQQILWFSVLFPWSSKYSKISTSLNGVFNFIWFLLSSGSLYSRSCWGYDFLIFCVGFCLKEHSLKSYIVCIYIQYVYTLYIFWNIDVSNCQIWQNRIENFNVEEHGQSENKELEAFERVVLLMFLSLLIYESCYCLTRFVGKIF